MTTMTTTTTTAVDAVADAMVTGDALGALLPLKHLLAPPVFADLCGALDVCPVHVTDLDTCADEGRSNCGDYGYGSPEAVYGEEAR